MYPADLSGEHLVNAEFRILIGGLHCAFQTFCGVYGMSRCRIPTVLSASFTAFATAAVLAMQPASPTPFTPSGLTGDGVTVSSSSNWGNQAARGTA